uniref:Uncharacterized protein n=1 Tax=Arundo donax TaxID=35708 RepID=A0A0A8Z458_ARUDO
MILKPDKSKIVT